MNLNRVKGYLEEHKEGLSAQEVQELLSNINGFQNSSGMFSDMTNVMRTINEYNILFVKQVQEYEKVPNKDMKAIPKKCEKVREILCTLSLLHTYLVLCSSNLKDSNFEMKNIRAYVTELNDKKEHFRSEKMTWSAILRSLSQEMSYASEMRKMDIEDKVGYLKYKDN